MRPALPRCTPLAGAWPPRCWGGGGGERKPARQQRTRSHPPPAAQRLTCGADRVRAFSTPMLAGAPLMEQTLLGALVRAHSRGAMCVHVIASRARRCAPLRAAPGAAPAPEAGGCAEACLSHGRVRNSRRLPQNTAGARFRNSARRLGARLLPSVRALLRPDVRTPFPRSLARQPDSRSLAPSTAAAAAGLATSRDARRRAVAAPPQRLAHVHQPRARHALQQRHLPPAPGVPARLPRAAARQNERRSRACAPAPRRRRW